MTTIWHRFVSGNQTRKDFCQLAIIFVFYNSEQVDAVCHRFIVLNEQPQLVKNGTHNET